MRGLSLNWKALATFALSAVLLAVVLHFVDGKEIVGELSKLSPDFLLYALVLLIANQVLGSARFGVLIGSRLGFPQFVRVNIANSLSVISGMLFFNIIGQGIARDRFLRDAGSADDAFAITSIERVLSLLSLVLLASVGGFFAFGTVTLGRSISSLTAAPALGILVSVVAVSIYLHRTRLASGIWSSLGGRLSRRILLAVPITLAMHAAMAGAYLVLAWDVVGGAFLVDLVGVVFVVMLASSLPISVAGWGVREITAGTAFGLIGLSMGAGIAVSVAIGILTIAALATNLLVSHAIRLFLPDRSTAALFDAEPTFPAGLTSLVFALPAFVLIGFMVRVPTASDMVTVNLADPFAIVAALSFLFYRVQSGPRNLSVWRVPGLGKALAAGLLVVLLSWLHGYVAFGGNDWALYNRLIGSLVLAAFVLTGAAIGYFHGRQGIEAAAKCFVISIAAVVVVEYVVRSFGLQPMYDYFLALGSPDFQGFSLNRNKFAFYLLAALVLTLAFWLNRNHDGGWKYAPWLGGLFLYGIVLSHSRSGMATAAIILGAGFLLKTFRLRGTLVAAAAFVALDLVVVFGLPILGTFLEQLGFPNPFAGGDGTGKFQAGQQLGAFQDDRLASFVGGFEMWMQNPVFGAGLGAFMERQIEETGVALVIHTSLLWLLAETGVVGTILVLLIPASILASLLRKRVAHWDRRDAALFFLLLCLAGMSIFHEMLYQRIFWLLLGLLAVATAAARTGSGVQDSTEPHATGRPDR